MFSGKVKIDGFSKNQGGQAGDLKALLMLLVDNRVSALLKQL